jgi:hypothetical protein
MSSPTSMPSQEASSTVESLERVDQVAFEKLADSLLRSANPDYAAVMHFGINAKGKTIKSPVDGFCKVPNSVPEHFIYVQHTTTEKKSLQEKWLNEITERKSTATQKKREKGDLIKAGELAAELRKKFPDASFTVVLTSNQSVDVDLTRRVLVKAKQLVLSTDIWEQTRITRFLDDKPEGHWLRWKHLTSLEPHLDRLGPEDIRGLGWEVERGKHYEWYQKHLKDRLSPGDRAHLFPDDDDLSRELSDFEKNPHRPPYYWLEDLERRRVTTKRLWPVLEKWFMASPTPKRQEIAFEIIENVGTRTELPLLHRIAKTLNTPSDNLALMNVDFSVRLRTLV